MFPKIVAGRLSAKMAIARYGSSPVEPDGIDEEASRLTRAAMEALGGMTRFVSKNEVLHRGSLAVTSDVLGAAFSARTDGAAGGP